MMRVGLLIIGIHGASASTLVTGYLRNKEHKAIFCTGSYWCAIAHDFPEPIYSLTIGGWDYRFANMGEAIRENHILPLVPDEDYPIEYYHAVLGPTDYPVHVEGRGVTHPSFDAAVESIRTDIANFKSKYQLDRVIVLNSSSPAYCAEGKEHGWSSNKAYAIGAVLEGADWVEFTPSDSISLELIELSKKTGSRLAGRDGSTGQTILKVCLRDFLESRGIKIHGWYSTNLIGNRDGLVLGHQSYNQTKLHDKLMPLPHNETGSGSHIVEIQYMPPAGDDKESWDCIYFSGWLNSNMSLRLNWHGKDSFLAAALMLDIIAGLIHADRNSFSSGLVLPLSLFFKNPIGCEVYTFEHLLSAFRKFATLNTTY